MDDHHAVLPPGPVARLFAIVTDPDPDDVDDPCVPIIVGWGHELPPPHGATFVWLSNPGEQGGIGSFESAERALAMVSFAEPAQLVWAPGALGRD